MTDNMLSAALLFTLIIVGEAIWLYPQFTDRAPFHIQGVYETFVSYHNSLDISVYYDRREGVQEHWMLGTAAVWSPPVTVAPNHFVWSSCSADNADHGSQYQCTSTLRARPALLETGYTFMLTYTSKSATFIQVEPIRLTEGIEREACDCGNPTFIRTDLHRPSWYLYPPSIVTVLFRQTLHLAWSFEGRFTRKNNLIYVVRSSEIMTTSLNGSIDNNLVSGSYEFLYREDGAVLSLDHVEISVAKRHQWNGLTPVDIDIIIHEATEEDMGVYSVRYGTEFLSNWGHQSSSVRLIQEPSIIQQYQPMYPGPPIYVQVADCHGNFTLGSLNIYSDQPTCIICSTAGFNVTLTMSKNGETIPRTDVRGNQLIAKSFFPDVIYVYYYFVNPEEIDSASYSCSAVSHGGHGEEEERAVWVDFVQ